MAGRAITKETIKKNTIEQMKELGVYKAEYDAIIDIYSEMMEQYNRLTKEFRDKKYKYSESTMQGGEKKAPIVSTLESLRKDILQYSDRLCLNPKANQLDGKGRLKKASPLAAAIKSIEK